MDKGIVILLVLLDLSVVFDKLEYSSYYSSLTDLNTGKVMMDCTEMG